MQGTLVVLMALSGLGCHHKACCQPAVPACTTGCYAAPMVDMGCGGCGAYTAPVYPAPAIVDYCGASMNYGCGSPCGGRRHGRFGGGLFRCHRRAACAPVSTC